MKTSDVRAMSINELKVKILDMKSELMHLRFQKKIGQLTDTGKLKNVKREIAKCFTVLNEKEKKDAKEK